MLPRHRAREIPAERHPIVVDVPQEPAKKPRPRPRTEPTTEQTDAVFERISRSLRRLAQAEEAFFAETGVYTEDVGKLAFRKDGQSRIEQIPVGRRRRVGRQRHGPRAIGTGLRHLRRAEPIPRPDAAICVGAASRACPSATCRSEHPTAAAADPTPPRPIDTTSALDAVSPAVQMRGRPAEDDPGPGGLSRHHGRLHPEHPGAAAPVCLAGPGRGDGGRRRRAIVGRPCDPRAASRQELCHLGGAGFSPSGDRTSGPVATATRHPSLRQLSGDLLAPHTLFSLRRAQ